MDITVTPLSIDDSQDELQDLFEQLTTDVSFDIKFLAITSDCYCAVVRQEGRLVSFGALSIYLVPDKGYVGTIQSLVTDKDYRKRGFGTEILLHLEAKAKELQLVRLELTSNPKRQSARRIYCSLDYIKSDTNVFYKNL